ncbi:isochorismate synthase [Streptomyces sp. NPDC023723]|uniref:isochorismate synthase n=1 Tax=Streptomyces sp. NPDC023723 TaxID=3154323 RepID=UPI0033E9A754
MSAPGKPLPGDRVRDIRTSRTVTPARTSFYFASPDTELIVDETASPEPVTDRVTDSVSTGLVTDPGAGSVAAVVERLRAAAGSGRPETAAVGMLPFRPDTPPRLTVTANVRMSRAATAPLPATVSAPRPRFHTARSEPAEEHYLAAVQEALRRLADGKLDKVVLARTLRLIADAPVDLPALVESLRRHNPYGYVFAAPLPGPGTLVGASPELLVAKRGRTVRSHPLAGTVARSADPAEDARRAEALLASAKNLHEHALVVEAVTATLRHYCRDVDAPARPSLTHTETLWHLGTPVRAILRDPATSSLELAAALHPTPAVCGTPADPARELISELEPFDRGFYAGAVGWCDARGDGEWAVTIRCAEVEDRSLRLYAGAGIVPGSTPAGELAETTAKFRTLLDALGLATRYLGRD